MNTYIVYNEALHHDSSYHEIVEVFATREQAEACIEKCKKDFLKDAKNGDFGDDFDFILPDSERIVTGNEWDTVLESEKGFYEAWRTEEHELEVPKRKWDIVYDEEVCDYAGRNFTGIISDGTNHLFFHAFMVNEDDSIETCIIYDSLKGLIDHNEDAEECRYPWTAENDARMLEALNNIPEGQSFCGENGVLHQVKFAEEKIYDPASLLGDLDEIFSAIAEEAGQNVSYSESLDGTTFPDIVELCIVDKQKAQYHYDAFRFQASNDHIIPKTLTNASNEEIDAYLRDDSNRNRILKNIADTAQRDYESRIGKKYIFS